MADMQDVLAGCYQRLVNKSPSAKSYASPSTQHDRQAVTPSQQVHAAAPSNPLSLYRAQSPSPFVANGHVDAGATVAAPNDASLMVVSAADREDQGDDDNPEYDDPSLPLSDVDVSASAALQSPFGRAPAVPGQRRRRRTKAQIAADRAMMSALKRKRGRPSKSDIIARQAMLLAQQRGMSLPQIEALKETLGAAQARKNMGGRADAGATPPGQRQKLQHYRSYSMQQKQLTSHFQQTQQRQQQQQRHVILSQAVGLDPSLVGRGLQGKVEGTFEGGYFVSVQVDGTNRLYRGVVFVPGVAVSVSEQGDVAPAAPVASPKTSARTTPFVPPHPSLRPPLLEAPAVDASASEAAASDAAPRPVSHDQTTRDSPIHTLPDASGALSARVALDTNGNAATAAVADAGAAVASAAVVPVAAAAAPVLSPASTLPNDSPTHAAADQTIKPQGSPPTADAAAESAPSAAEDAIMGSSDAVPAAEVAAPAPSPSATPVSIPATVPPPQAA